MRGPVSGGSRMRGITELPQMPFDRQDVLLMAPKVLELQAASPIARVRTPTGDEAWYVTGFEEAMTLFGDPRLGKTHPKPHEAARISNSPLMGGAVEGYDSEDADHARMRSSLVPYFSARRMRALAPRVQQMVDALLDDLATKERPADLHEALSFPLPVSVLVICELLGAPSADAERFRAWSAGMADLADADHAMQSMGAMESYLRELVARKRIEPADDILSELLTVEDGAMSDADVARLGAIVLFAGHETTVVRIDVGTLLLLSNPDQRAALIADENAVPSAVEEILRRGSAVGGKSMGGLIRYARTDIEAGGVTIRAGDAVILVTGAANQDERVFAEPDSFDIGRTASARHLAFGYGAHYCIGATLARIELKAVFGALFQRFPTLELAVPVEELRWRDDLVSGGFTGLPVTW